MRHSSDILSRYVWGRFGNDTAAVLFLLAMEYARAVRIFSTDGTLMAATMAMVLILPYFLPSAWHAPALITWLTVRSGVLFAGLITGAIFGAAVGPVLPASWAFLPMTLAILTGMLSCYVQFYGLMRLRLAK